MPPVHWAWTSVIFVRRWRGQTHHHAHANAALAARRRSHSTHPGTTRPLRCNSAGRGLGVWGGRLSARRQREQQQRKAAYYSGHSAHLGFPSKNHRSDEVTAEKRLFLGNGGQATLHWAKRDARSLASPLTSACIEEARRRLQLMAPRAGMMRAAPRPKLRCPSRSPRSHAAAHAAIPRTAKRVAPLAAVTASDPSIIWHAPPASCDPSFASSSTVHSTDSKRARRQPWPVAIATRISSAVTAVWAI